MMRQPVTYLEIQKWVYRRHGFIPKTCWIAHRKELCGLPLGAAASSNSSGLGSHSVDL
jgi:hypothetical protein